MMSLFDTLFSTLFLLSLYGGILLLVWTFLISILCFTSNNDSFLSFNLKVYAIYFGIYAIVIVAFLICGFVV